MKGVDMHGLTEKFRPFPDDGQIRLVKKDPVTFLAANFNKNA
jgi:hypothetical protein